MRWAAILESGEIQATGEAPDGAGFSHFLPELTIRECSEVVTPTSHYWNGEALVAIPTKPTPHHMWDWGTKSWFADVCKAKQAKKIAVDSAREVQNTLPLVYDSKNLDADLQAQKNLSDKLQEVRERIRINSPMPAELLIWRDADNVTHTFTDLQSYHDWLSGFTIAIAERGTRLYTKAWQHKHSIEQLTTVDEVLNYSIGFV